MRPAAPPRDNPTMPPLDFATVAARRSPELDELSLALAGEFREVDEDAALLELDRLGADLAEAAGGSPLEEAAACREVLAERHGFKGTRKDYDDPANSMLDLVLSRRRGLPILLSVVYVEAARRAGIALSGVGMPGHYVVGHFGADPPILLDPFNSGPPVEIDGPPEIVRPWTPHETALRMLNNLVGAYARRGDVGSAIRAAELRLTLPLGDSARESLVGELRSLRARLN